MALALDGAAANTTNHGTSDSTSASLTTANTNDIIIAFATAESSGTPSINSVSGGGLTWTRRNTNTTTANFSGATKICCEIWWAPAPTALTSASITCSANLGTAGNVGLIVFGVSGVPLSLASNPFDSNGSVPAMTANQTSTNSDTHDTSLVPSITTDNPHTFIFGLYMSDGGASNRVDTPDSWTDVGVANEFTAGPGRCRMLAEYFVKSTTVSAFKIQFRDFANGWQIIGDALTSDVASNSSTIAMTLGQFTQEVDGLVAPAVGSNIGTLLGHFTQALTDAEIFPETIAQTLFKPTMALAAAQSFPTVIDQTLFAPSQVVSVFEQVSAGNPAYFSYWFLGP